MQLRPLQVLGRYVYGLTPIAAFIDVSVTCSEQDQGTGDEVATPLLIAEVLSDSTEARDRERKFGYYRACLPIQEYVLIATRYQAIEVYHRTTHGWTSYHMYGPGDVVEFESLDIRIPLVALYRRTTVPEGLNDVEGEI
jgi:Uma2 family endonuclease